MAETARITDPSANVQLFVGNAVKYLEDLHNAAERGTDEKLRLHFEYARRESDAETERINALRADDVKAVAIANDRAVKQAEVLATQVATSAEALRILVAQTADTIAKNLTLVTSQLIERIAALEKVQYENQGKSGASSTLLDRVTELEGVNNQNKGSQLTIGRVFAMIAATGAVMGIVVILANLFAK